MEKFPLKNEGLEAEQEIDERKGELNKESVAEAEAANEAVRAVNEAEDAYKTMMDDWEASADKRWLGPKINKDLRGQVIEKTEEAIAAEKKYLEIIKGSGEPNRAAELSRANIRILENRLKSLNVSWWEVLFEKTE